MQFSPGDIVRSTAGRDTGHLYVVIEVTLDRVLVADGRRRDRSKPKAKNPLHLQLVKRNEARILTDDDLRQTLHTVEQSQVKEKGGN